ncbi:hypothetical protein ACEI10_002224 [Vibrio harveyi]
MNKIKVITNHATPSMIPDAAKDISGNDISLCKVELNLKKINEVWKKDSFSYSGVGGDDRKENKIQGVADYIDKHNQVHAPILYITCDNPEYLQFADGRHTTAYLLESGHESMTFIIPLHQKGIILNSFG